MPQFRSRIVAILLVAVFVGSGLMAAVSVLPAKPVASCHGQSHSKSTPQPGYQCCVAGHSTALQPSVFDAFVPFAASASVKSPIFIDPLPDAAGISKNTASPPPLIALRI